MAIIEINKNPSKRELAWFGVIVALFCGLVGALLYWRFGLHTSAYVVWTLGAALTLVYQAIPPIRRSLYVAWLYLFFPLGWLLSHLVLGVIYYLVITPTGLIMRMLGRDSMGRRFDAEAETYWVKRDPNIKPSRYFRQF